MQLQHSLHRPPSCIGGWLSSMCLLPGISPKPIAQFVTAFDACCPLPPARATCPVTSSDFPSAGSCEMQLLLQQTAADCLTTPYQSLLAMAIAKTHFHWPAPATAPIVMCHLWEWWVLLGLLFVARGMRFWTCAYFLQEEAFWERRSLQSTLITLVQFNSVAQL